MGQRLKALFAKADAIGGLKAKIRLATLVKLTSTQAESAPDDPAAIERVQRGLDQVARELGVTPIAAEEPPPLATAPREERLMVYLHTVGDLLSQRSLYLGDVEATMARMMEAAAITLDVARASVWMYDEANSAIHCADLFTLGEGVHSKGTVLSERDFPEYFAALKRERSIAANNAHTDPRTACFSASYLTPLGIGAMLDVPIWIGGRMAGVICHEHVGGDREWTQDDEAFAVVLANLISLAVETRKTPATHPL